MAAAPPRSKIYKQTCYDRYTGEKKVFIGPLHFPVPPSIRERPPIRNRDECLRKAGHPLVEKALIKHLKGKIEDPHNYRAIVGCYFFKTTEDNLYESHPEELLEGDGRRYYFVRRKINGNGGRSRPLSRTTKNGYWKSTTKNKVINVVKLYEKVKIGLRHRFVFYTGKSPRGTRSQYGMHEYHLDDDQYPISTKMDDYWVLCEVFKNHQKVVPKISEQAIVDTANACIDEGYDFSFDSDASE